MSFYEALSHPPTGSTEPTLEVYRKPPPLTKGKIQVETPFKGYVYLQHFADEEVIEEYDLGSRRFRPGPRNLFNIAYTEWGDKGPLVLFIPGVPSNRDFGWYEIQKRMSPFCRTISIDMLGMGESDKPRHYGVRSRDAS